VFRRIQAKFAVLLAAVAVVAIVGELAFVNSERHRSRQFFDASVRQSAMTLDGVLELRGTSLAAFVNDYTYWDDMVRFVATGDSCWAEVNLVPSLNTFGASVCAVYRRDGSLVYSCASDSTVPAMAPDPAWFRKLDSTRLSHFFVPTPAGILEVRGATIHPSSDAERRSIPRGYMLAGRVWTGEYLADLTRLVGAAVTLLATSPGDTLPAALTPDNGQVVLRRQFPGPDGRPVATLSSTFRSSLMGTFVRTTRWTAAAATVLSAVLIVLLGLCLYLWVTRPMGMIARALRTDDARQLGRLPQADNEFGRVARLVAGSFEKQASLTREVRERQKAESALRESEERFRDLFENANDLIQSVGPDGRYLYTNSRWREALGYTEEEVGRLTMFDVLAPESHDHCRQVFGGLMSGGHVECEETVFLTKEGRRVYVEGNLSCQMKDGKPVATRGFFRDVTERKRHEQELADKSAELAQLNEVKNQLLGMAAHDLRNPLSVILTASSFMAGDGGTLLPEAKKVDFIRRIKANSQFMLKLIDDLLDVAKIESGRLDLGLEEADIVDVIDDSLGLNDILAEQKGIALQFDRPPGLPRLRLDRDKVEQVLNNLVSNALKFSDPGTTVRVTAARLNGSVVVSVKDQGRGIPAAELDKLFQPFGKTSVKSTAGERSTGLGLAIARKIVEGHKGRIWAESEVGKGSTFSFSLPVGSS
jgi:PAS domain S-box-containing protein